MPGSTKFSFWSEGLGLFLQYLFIYFYFFFFWRGRGWIWEWALIQKWALIRINTYGGVIRTAAGNSMVID